MYLITTQAAIRRTLVQMGVSCVYESCTNHRPLSSETKVSALIGNRTPIPSNQRGSELTHQRCRRPTRTGSSLAFQSHRAVPNLVHFPLIAPCRGNFLHFLAFLFLHLSPPPSTFFFSLRAMSFETFTCSPPPPFDPPVPAGLSSALSLFK